MALKCILFDLDGTILDTLEDLNDAVNYAISKLGYKNKTVSETKANIGNGIRNLVLRSLNYNESDLDFAYNEFRAYYNKNCDNKTKAYDGIYEILDYCKNNNLYLGVLTNKKQDAADILIKNHFDGYFDIVIGERPGLKRKPEPDGLNYICNYLNINKDEVLYIGDSEVDFSFINKVNIKGLIVGYGYRSPLELKNSGCDVVYNNTSELLNAIKSNLQ